MAIAHAIEARVLAGAHQVAGGFQLGGGDVDRLEQAAGEQAGELAGIAGVGLDPVARALWNEAGCDHLAVEAALDQVPVEAEAGRARLVAAAHLRPAAKGALDSPLS